MDDLTKRGRAALQRIGAVDEINGYIGKPDGAGGYIYAVPHHPGFTYVRVNYGVESSIAEAINTGAMPDPSLKVKLVRENGVLVIQRPDAASAALLYGVNVGSAAQPPAQQTESAGNGAAVENGRLLAGKVRASDSGGLRVYVHPYQGWAGGDLTIDSGDVPSGTNEMCWCVVYLSATAQPAYVVGSVRTGANTSILSIADAVAVSLPTGAIRLFAVSLITGQTQINETTSRIVDVRDHYGAQGIGHYICIVDAKTINTDGGTFTSGAWQTRDVNTELADTGDFASVSGNQITLAAGTYRCEIECPAYEVNAHQARLYNATGSAVVSGTRGTSAYAGTGVSNVSVITGRFTLTTATVLEVHHRCSSTKSTDGFGKKVNFTEDETYTIMRFWRE